MTSVPWSPREIEKLRALADSGDSWDFIAGSMPGRTVHACRYAYRTRFGKRERVAPVEPEKPIVALETINIPDEVYEAYTKGYNAHQIISFYPQYTLRQVMMFIDPLPKKRFAFNAQELRRSA